MKLVIRFSGWKEGRPLIGKIESNIYRYDLKNAYEITNQIVHDVIGKDILLLTQIVHYFEY